MLPKFFDYITTRHVQKGRWTQTNVKSKWEKELTSIACVCVPVCMYVGICVCVCVSVCMWVYVFVCVCLYVCGYMCLCVCVSVCMWV